MVLRFLCPNGHKIHCPDQRAGRAAKCPKCGVKFQVPEVSDIDVSGSSGSLPAVTDSGPSVSIGGSTSRRPGEPEIEFLCPNGHRLHGPAGMQGRPGQCPHCGARFRVPSYDEEDERGAGEQEEAASPAPHLEIEVVGHARQPAAVQAVDEESTAGAVGEPPRRDSRESASNLPAEHEMTTSRVVPVDAPGPLGSADNLPTLAEIFSKLWSEKAAGAQVELQLVDGETLTPDHFAAALSQGSHAVFATREPDATHTLTAIAWQSIARVVVRGVKQLPSETLG